MCVYFRSILVRFALCVYCALDLLSIKINSLVYKFTHLAFFMTVHNVMFVFFHFSTLLYYSFACAFFFYIRLYICITKMSLSLITLKADAFKGGGLYALHYLQHLFDIAPRISVFHGTTVVERSDQSFQNFAFFSVIPSSQSVSFQPRHGTVHYNFGQQPRRVAMYRICIRKILLIINTVHAT